MANFRLTNSDSADWKPDEFIVIDTDIPKQLHNIVLTVRWDAKTATVSTLSAHMRSTINDIFGNSITFKLPFNVDAHKFPEYFKTQVQPVLEEMVKSWKGGFLRLDRFGYFDFGESIGERGQKEQEFYVKIQDLLRAAPRHEGMYFWSLSEVYPTPGDLFLKLDSFAIDLVETNLYDPEKVEAIRTVLEKDCTYLINDETFKYELILSQEKVDYSVKQTANTQKRLSAIKSNGRKIDRMIGKGKAAGF